MSVYVERRNDSNEPVVFRISDLHNAPLSYLIVRNAHRRSTKALILLTDLLVMCAPISQLRPAVANATQPNPRARGGVGIGTLVKGSGSRDAGVTITACSTVVGSIRSQPHAHQFRGKTYVTIKTSATPTLHRRRCTKMRGSETSVLVT